MKKLIYKTIVLFGGTILLFLIYAFFQNKYISEQISFKVNPETTMAIFGHSHVETAYNDTLISRFQNFGKSGEAYFYIYPKLKKILKDNKQIKTVFIELTNNQVHLGMDEWIWGKKYLSSKFKIQEPFIALEDQAVILQHNPIDYIMAFLSARKTNTDRISNKDFTLTNYHKFGGYKFLVRDKTDSLVETYKEQPKSKSKEIEVSKVNILYLEKMISFIERRGIKLFFIRTPQHTLAFTDENETFFKEIQEKRFDGISFLDFNKFLLRNSEFGDFGHLNYKGARKFSLFFDQLLEKGLLEREDKQAFIDEEAAIFSAIDHDSIEGIYKVAVNKFNKNVLFKILKNSKPSAVNFSFTDSLVTRNLYTYSQNQTGTLIFELHKDLPLDYLNDKAFGVHATIYEKDKHLQPTWFQEKNIKKLTLRSIPEKIKFEGKNYILMPYDKKCSINEFKQVYLFMMNRQKYTGTIGKGLILDNLKL